METWKIYKQMCEKYDFDNKPEIGHNIIDSYWGQNARLSLLLITLGCVLIGGIVGLFLGNKNKELEKIVQPKMEMSLIRPEEKTQDYTLIKYIVKDGDTFSEIANDNGYGIKFLKEFNPQFKNKGYDLIHPGDVVYMPKFDEGRK